MSTIRRTYALERFTDPYDANFLSALGVYVTNIGPSARTNSNDIAFWLERTYGEFGDEFCVFGFYLNRQIIGFAQCVWFKRQRMLFFDYLVLHKDHRSNSEYFQFVERLQEWLDDNLFEFDYVVAEVAFDSPTSTPSRHSILLVELFRRAGFHVADCEYWQPPLGVDNPESDTRAHLLITAREPISAIRKDTLVGLVRAIYFEHYKRWYDLTLRDLEAKSKYGAWLDERFASFSRQLRDCTEIVLNGIELLPSSRASKRAPRRRRGPALLAPLTVVGVTALLIFGLTIVMHWLVPSISGFMLAIVGSVLVVVTAFALFSKAARETLNLWMKFATTALNKRK